MNPPEVLRTVLAGDPATLPERLVRTVVTVWDDPVRGRPLRALVSSAGHDPEVARLLREVLQAEMIGPLAERFGGPDASARAAAFGAQVAGLLLVRYWLAAEPIASMPVEELVRHAGPGLHAAMRGAGRPAPPPRGGVGGGAGGAPGGRGWPGGLGGGGARPPASRGQFRLILGSPLSRPVPAIEHFPLRGAPAFQAWRTQERVASWAQ